MSNRITAPFPNWNSTSEGICLLFKITYYIAKQTRLDLEGGYTSMLLCDYRSVPTDFTFFHTCWDKWHTHSRIGILKIFNVSYLSSYKQSLLEYFPKLQTWIHPQGCIIKLESFLQYSWFDSSFLPWSRSGSLSSFYFFNDFLHILPV